MQVLAVSNLILLQLFPEELLFLELKDYRTKSALGKFKVVSRNGTLSLYDGQIDPPKMSSS